MSAPPGHPATAAFAPEGEAPQQGKTLRACIREFLDSAGLVRTESWVTRVSRDYARLAFDGMPIGTFIATRLALSDVERRHLAERADLRYLLSYADPTGEQAIRNVLTARGF